MAILRTQHNRLKARVVDSVAANVMRQMRLDDTTAVQGLVISCPTPDDANSNVLKNAVPAEARIGVNGNLTWKTFSGNENALTTALSAEILAAGPDSIELVLKKLGSEYEISASQGGAEILSSDSVAQTVFSDNSRVKFKSFDEFLIKLVLNPAAQALFAGLLDSGILNAIYVDQIGNKVFMVGNTGANSASTLDVEDYMHWELTPESQLTE